MANIYSINNELENPNENFQIPSVAYVKNLIKKLEDLVIEMQKIQDPNNKDIESRINYDESVEMEEFPLITGMPESIDVDSINTDANHKFISDTQLAVIKDKPSYLQLEAIVMDLRNEFKADMDQYFINLLNNKDALQKIRDIAAMLQDSNKFSSIVNSLASKVSKTDFEKHTRSIFHVTNNDRKALNLLIDFIREGCADWEADEEAPNYIRNKPVSMPADGGNADTIDGFGVESLLNHQIETMIIGADGYNYDINTVDTAFETDENNIAYVTDFISEYITDTEENSYGIFKFKPGIYNVDGAAFKGSGAVFEGSGVSTVFIANSLRIDGDIELKNLQINNIDNTQSNFISIGSNCTIDNVRFNKCIITLDNSGEINIRNCTFNECDFLVSGICHENMINNNRFIFTNEPRYFGGNNIIANNISY